MVKTGPDYPRLTVPHIRVVAGGTLGTGGPEIWSCTMKVTSFPVQTAAQKFFSELSGALISGVAAEIASLVEGDTGSTDLDAYADDHAVPAWKSFFGLIGSAAASLTYVKVNAFGADDKQVNATTIDRQFTPVQGGGPAGTPFTSALVVDFRSTHKTRGTATHGRISLPSSVTVDGTGQITTVGGSAFSTIPARVGTFLSGLNAGSSSGNQLLPAIVYTEEVGRPYKLGTVDRTPKANAIDTYLVSSLPGIVRRRGNKLKQSSHLAAVDYGSDAAS